MGDLSSGLVLMALGMTVVFLFLGVLVLLMGAIKRIAVFFPEKAPPAPGKPGSKTSRPTQGEVAAITAAVQQYIRSKGARR